jgi:hypothetical protein
MKDLLGQRERIHNGAVDGVTGQMNEHSFILSEARHEIKKKLPSRGNSWAPAFWVAFGAPASHGQRGHSGGIGETVTTLPARWRPHSDPE